MNGFADVKIQAPTRKWSTSGFYDDDDDDDVQHLRVFTGREAGGQGCPALPNHPLCFKSYWISIGENCRSSYVRQKFKKFRDH